VDQTGTAHEIELAAAAAPIVEHAWNIDATPFVPSSGCCEVDWDSLVINITRVPRRRPLRDPRALDDELLEIAIPKIVRICSGSKDRSATGEQAEAAGETCGKTRNLFQLPSKAYTTYGDFREPFSRTGQKSAVDGVWGDSGEESEEESEYQVEDYVEAGCCLLDGDAEEAFGQNIPSGSHGWYVKLVPERYKWEPTAGIGEREWSELVQEVAVTARNMLTSFSNASFPPIAARKLLAILAVQNLQNAWAEGAFATLFANRFAHPTLVSKGIEVISQCVCECFDQKKQAFIDKDIVGELIS
jgi:hypothetical protein